MIGRWSHAKCTVTDDNDEYIDNAIIIGDAESLTSAIDTLQNEILKIEGVDAENEGVNAENEGVENDCGVTVNYHDLPPEPCVQERNTERICKISRAYFIIATMDKKTKTDKVWLFGSVGKLKWLGQTSKEKINELRIHTTADLQLHVNHHGIPKVHIQGFGRIYDIALQDLPGNPPSSFKDHRKAENLYLSRYGERWVEKLKSSTAMSKLCCISDLIRFVMNGAEKLMKGSVHEGNFFIVHDALVLMTTMETINWMIKKGYLHR